MPIYNCFSLRNNIKALYYKPTSLRFAHIDGLRAIAILWMIGFHSLWMMGYFYAPADFKSLILQPLYSPLIQGHYGVDIFFVISGFLIAHILFSEIKKTGKIALKHFYFNRALRILPAYFCVLCLLMLMSSKNIENSWANVLYLNNFISISDQFMSWAWSLAIEEQFYTLCPLMLLILFRYHQPVLTLLIGLFIFSFIIQDMIYVLHDLKAPIAIHPSLGEQTFVQYFDLIYDKPYTRYGGLLIGVIIAYLLLFTSTVHWLESHLFWRRFLLMLATGIILFSILFPTIKANNLDPILFRLYIMSYRNLFSIAIAYWVIYGITMPGKQSIITRCLSARFWYPIAQLSYSAYLLHLIFIAALYKSVYATEKIPNLLQILGIIGFFILLTFFFALILFLMVEKPFMNLRKAQCPVFK